MKVDDAVVKAALIQQLQPQADLVGQSWIATSHNDGGEEQMTLVDQTELQSLSSERWAAYGDVARGSRFQLLDRFRFELPLNLYIACGYSVQTLGVHDLVRCLQIFAYSCPAEGSSLPVGAVSQ